MLALLLSAAAHAVAGEGKPLFLHENGVERLDDRTPFQLETIRALFPSLTVRQEERVSHHDGISQPYSVIVVSDIKGPLLTIISDGFGRIASVGVDSRRVRNRQGPRLGDVFSDDRSLCQDSEVSPGTRVCRSPAATRIFYRLRRHDAATSGDPARPSATRRPDTAKIDGITWVPR